MSLSIQQQKDIAQALEDYVAAFDDIAWAEEDVITSEGSFLVPVTLWWGTVEGGTHEIQYESADDFIRGVNKLAADADGLFVRNF